MAATPGSQTLVSDIIEVMDDMRVILYRATDIVQRYFDCDYASEVNALPAGTDKLNGKITKNDILGAITALQQYQNFMNNAAVSTNTYRITINKVAALRE